MGKKKQKTKQKQKKQQKQLTARQQKQLQRKQEQKQKRQQTAKQKQAEKQRLFEARQKERQEEIQKLKPKRRQKSENRKELEKRFRELVDKSNEILDKFDEEERRYIFEDDYGAIFDDKTIMTQKGKFRKNASELTNKELEQRNKMLSTFIEDSDEYEKDADAFEDFAEDMAEDTGIPFEEYEKDFWDFVNFIKAIIGNIPNFSEVIEMCMNVADTRFRRGESLDEIKNAFYTAWTNSEDIADFITKFSGNGILL